MDVAESSSRTSAEIAGYNLDDEIGDGGFGKVWIAREKATGVRQAIKLIQRCNPEAARRELSGLQKYRQAALHHPHLVQVNHVGENESHLYCVMEPADDAAPDGEGPYKPLTLRLKLQEAGRFEPLEALRTIRKLLSACETLSASGLSHNDLKPDNVLIVQGEPKIADVGLMSSLDRQSQAGTKGYRTPEGRADDLYALGKILYELVTGRPANEYPQGIPVEFARHPTPAAKAAVRIMNRAASQDPRERFTSVADFLRAVDRGLKPAPTLPRKLVAYGLGLLVSLTATIAYLWLRTPAMKLISGGPRDWKLVKPHGDYPFRGYTWDDGVQLSTAGTYAVELPEPIENYVLDLRFRTPRPWGDFRIGLGSRPDLLEAVTMDIAAMPDGVELKTGLTVYHADPAFPSLVDPAGEQIGQPMHGVDYAVRIARCSDGIKMAMWPLATTVRRPFVQTVSEAPGPDFVRYLLLVTRTTDPHAQIEIQSIKVYDAGRRLPRIDEPPFPFDDEQLVVPQLRPLSPVSPDELGNNLLASFHPFDTDLWTSLGSWAWWSGLGPDRDGNPKPVRCVPFSTERRSLHGECFDYGLMQVLRFDGAEFDDFSATVRVNLKDPRSPDALVRGTNVCDSSAFCVGLLFRLQDEPQPGYAWSGGYGAWIQFLSSMYDPPEVVLCRLVGGRLDHPDQRFVGLNYVEDKLAPAALKRINWPESSSRFDGFDLTVSALGPDFTLSLDGREILTWTDPSLEYHRRGRVALLSQQLIATFESVSIEPQ